MKVVHSLDQFLSSGVGLLLPLCEAKGGERRERLWNFFEQTKASLLVRKFSEGLEGFCGGKV